jgi:hypothetical protein
MRRALVAFGALTLVGLGLAGCGLFRFEQREPWRTQAEEACLSQQMVQPSAYMSQASKIDGPGSCGMDYPFKVAAFSNGSVGVSRKLTLACPIIPRIDTWLEEVVKPASVLYYGVPVIDLKAGSYSCRPRNNQAGAKVSEHAYGNALDVMAFVLADGREVSVLKGWKGDPTDQDFLREVFVGACRHFTTVLGPGADAFHYDHLHIDLARHDPYGERRICKPILKFTPRIDVLQAGRAAPTAPSASADIPAIDLEEDVPVNDAPAMTHREPAPWTAPTYAAAPAAPPRPIERPPAALPSYPPPPRPQPVPNPYQGSVYSRPSAAGQPPIPEPYRGPVVQQRPPAAGQPQVLNGHGLY